jgi:hypothetical protein
VKHNLYLAYLKEQYDAARHHQTMRIATTALLFAAAAAILSKATEKNLQWQTLAGIGAILIALGITNVVLSNRFHYANRLHTEIASWIRKLLADLPDSPDACPDPNVVRKAVADYMDVKEAARDKAIFHELSGRFPKLTEKESGGPSEKIEMSLRGPLRFIPILVILGGVASMAAAILRWWWPGIF